MHNLKAIRERLGVTQQELANGIGCTQGNIGHYERGQMVPPDAARRLISYAKCRGVAITFDDIYGGAPSIGVSMSARPQPEAKAAA